METIKILTIHHTLPTVTSDTTLFFQSVLPELKKMINVKLIWLVYMPDKIPPERKNDETILDIHDFKNFVDILEKTKPDLVYAAATYNLIDLAASVAARFLNIPVLSKIYSRLGIVKDSKFMVKTHFTKFFDSSVPTDVEKTNRFMRRGRFFLYKYKFLFETFRATRLSYFESLKQVVGLIKYFLRIGTHQGYPEFANTLHWLESDSLVGKLVEMGYDRNSLIVTGNPMYDLAFQKINNIKPKKVEDKINVLFAPIAFYEHGMWTRSKNEQIFANTIEEISKNKAKFQLTVKIHPSSQKLDYYKSMLEKNNCNVPILQNGDILDFLFTNDVIVSYAGHSTALVYVLLSKKPLILCNFFNDERGPLLERGLAVECNDPKKLKQTIINAVNNYPIKKEKIDDFIEEFFFKTDGKAAERVSDAIIRLVEQRTYKK